MGIYQIGDIVDLQKITPIQNCNTRLATVVEIHKYFVICKSIKNKYLECINVNEGKKNHFSGYLC